MCISERDETCAKKARLASRPKAAIELQSHSADGRSEPARPADTAFAPCSATKDRHTEEEHTRVRDQLNTNVHALGLSTRNAPVCAFGCGFHRCELRACVPGSFAKAC